MKVYAKKNFFLMSFIIVAIAFYCLSSLGSYGFCSSEKTISNPIQVFLGALTQTEPSSLTVYPWQPFSREKVLPLTPTSHFPPGNHIVVKGCRGEYEPGSFIIHANKDLEDITLVVSELKKSSGATIPSDAVDLRLVKCWFQGGEGTIRMTKKKVLTPELLLRDDSLVRVDSSSGINYLRVTVSGHERYVDISSENGAPPPLSLFDDAPSLLPFSLPANNNKQVWVTVRIPQEAQTGMYRGKFDLMVGGKSVTTIGLDVEVLPFDLIPPMLDYGLYYRGVLTQKMVTNISSEGKNSAQYRAELQNMYEHGVQYPTLFQHVQDDSLNKALTIRDQYPFRKDRLFTLGTTTANKTDNEGLQQLDSRLSVWELKAAEHGYHSVYIYGIDEAVGDRLNAQRVSWNVVHQRGMKVFVAVYEGAVGLIGDTLDQPILSGYKPQEVKLWHNQGKRVYCYGNPQVGVEDPRVYRENYGYRLWLGGYDGCMLYAYQHGFGEIWNDFDSPEFRDHVFAYPTRTGVIDTVQWEGFREGIDDIRYLSTILAAPGVSTSSINNELSARLAVQGGEMTAIRSWLIEQMAPRNTESR
ncbi:MAG: hypothetical protein JZU65_05230 [Chlorobium sp.]|nr:hypothetical protein [Chlorobium sp.]